MFASSFHNTRRVVVVGMLVIAILIGALLAAGPSQSARLATSHEVRPGETLWSIASTTYGGDPRPHVDAIIHDVGN